MAEIPVSSPIRTILPADKHAKDKPRKRDPDGGQQGPPELSPQGPGHDHDGAGHRDVFTLSDIPVEELTPIVKKTLSDLLGQVDGMRDELAHAKSHILYLEELSESHTYLPVINRRGLHRELSRMLALGERAGVSNTFVCFHVRNMESIRRKFGQGAAEAGLTWAAEVLSTNCRDTDIVGSLGGHDFGLILTLADSESAAEKADTMGQALETGSFPWDGEKLSLHTVHGLHVFEPGDNAETVMARADADLLKRESDIGP